MSDRPRNRHLDALRVPRRMIHVDACGEDVVEEMAEELETVRGELELVQEECTIASCVAEFEVARADMFEGVLMTLVANAWDVDTGGDKYCRWCACTQDVAHEFGCAVGVALEALAEDKGGDSEVEA